MPESQLDLSNGKAIDRGPANVVLGLRKSAPLHFKELIQLYFAHCDQH